MSATLVVASQIWCSDLRADVLALNFFLHANRESEDASMILTSMERILPMIVIDSPDVPDHVAQSRVFR